MDTRLLILRVQILLDLFPEILFVSYLPILHLLDFLDLFDLCDLLNLLDLRVPVLFFSSLYCLNICSTFDMNDFPDPPDKVLLLLLKTGTLPSANLPVKLMIRIIRARPSFRGSITVMKRGNCRRAWFQFYGTLRCVATQSNSDNTFLRTKTLPTYIHQIYGSQFHEEQIVYCKQIAEKRSSALVPYSCYVFCICLLT